MCVCRNIVFRKQNTISVQIKVQIQVQDSHFGGQSPEGLKAPRASSSPAGSFQMPKYYQLEMKLYMFRILPQYIFPQKGVLAWG